MKIVVNKCFGGFSISIQALKELVIRNAACIESYTPKHYYGGEFPHNDQNWEAKWKSDFNERFKDIGDGFMGDVVMGFNIFKDGLLYGLKSRYEDQTRVDKDLIDVVKKLKEKANGSCAKLAIVDIPDDVEWEIDEYDGIETVHEKHRSW